MFKLLTPAAALMVLLSTQLLYSQNPNKFQRTTLYEGKLTFSRDGATVDVPFMVEEFIIDGGQKIDNLDLRFEGILIVQLRGGELLTQVARERTERHVSEFWVVPPGDRLIMETEDDSAIIRIYLLGKEYLEISGQVPIVSKWQKGRGPYKMVADNLYAKESHLIGSPEHPIARILDLNIGPNEVSKATSLPGAAQLQLISGGRELRVNEKRLEKGLGATLTLAEGESLTIDNRQGEKPARFRAIVFQN
jgi:hypothetical protein